MLNDDPMTLKQLGRYQLLKLINTGGMGEVWLAEDPLLHRQVAIKTLPSRSHQDQAFTLRFEREAQAVASLSHPHILPIHDFGEQTFGQGQVISYLVMPYIQEGSLSTRLKQYRQTPLLNPQEAFSYLEQAAEAIDYAHNRGIIHRDIKPSNMLLRSDNWLLLTDFGIARILNQTADLTQTQLNPQAGTPSYMAPEQAQGKTEKASDIYSLAVIAYQLFTGHLPFEAESPYAITIQHITTPPPSPRQFNPHLTLAFETALLRGLAKSPDHRPPSAKMLVEDLRANWSNNSQAMPYLETLPAHSQWLSQSGKMDEIQTTPTPLSSIHQSRRTLLLAAGGAFLLAGGGLAAWAIASSRQHQQGTPTPDATSSVPENKTPNAPLTSFLLRGHNKPAFSLSWSPTANILASGGSNGEDQVIIWDIENIVRQGQQPGKPKAQQTVSTGQDLLVSWSPTGEKLAVANLTDTTDLNNIRIKVFNKDISALADGYNEHFALNAVSIDTMSWTPGDNLCTISEPPLSQLTGSPTITLWDGQQPQHTLSKQTLSRHLSASGNTARQMHLLAFSSQASPLMMAIGTSDGISITTVQLTNGKSPQWKEIFLLKFPGQEKDINEVGGVDWAADGQRVAAIKDKNQKPKTVSVWDIHTEQIFHDRSLTPDTKATLTSIAWNPTSTSNILAAGATDGKVYLWDTTTTTLPQTVKSPPSGLNGAVIAIAWSEDGQWLAASYDDLHASIVVWKM